MSTTTTIRMEDELKERVSAAAEQAGKTAHAFMLEAIAEAVAQAEFDAETDRICEERWAEFLKTGEAIPWEEVKAYMKATAAGEKVERPLPRKVF